MTYIFGAGQLCLGCAWYHRLLAARRDLDSPDLPPVSFPPPLPSPPRLLVTRDGYRNPINRADKTRVSRNARRVLRVLRQGVLFTCDGLARFVAVVLAVAAYHRGGTQTRELALEFQRGVLTPIGEQSPDSTRLRELLTGRAPHAQEYRSTEVLCISSYYLKFVSSERHSNFSSELDEDFPTEP